MIYDLSYILSGNLSETEVKDRQKEKNAYLKGQAVKVLHEATQGSRKLPYKIKNMKFGHFFDFIFESEPDTMKKIEKAFSLDTDIVKYFVVKRKTWVAPAPKQWRTEGTEKPEVAMAHPAPVSAPIAVAPMSEEELNKKIDQILETPII